MVLFYSSKATQRYAYQSVWCKITFAEFESPDIVPGSKIVTERSTHDDLNRDWTEAKSKAHPKLATNWNPANNPQQQKKRKIRKEKIPLTLTTSHLDSGKVKSTRFRESVIRSGAVSTWYRLRFIQLNCDRFHNSSPAKFILGKATCWTKKRYPIYIGGIAKWEIHRVCHLRW